MADHGYHPLGKYSSARDDALHFLCTNGWDNGEFGNVSDYGAYFWQISNAPADVQQENGEFNSVIEDWFKDNPEVTDSPELRSELVGHFVVSETDSGAVSVQAFDSEDALDKFWRSELERYAELGEDDEDDVAGCSCGMADYGEPGHDGDPDAE